jgi:lipopolysaccharide export system permease protein
LAAGGQFPRLPNSYHLAGAAAVLGSVVFDTEVHDIPGVEREDNAIRYVKRRKKPAVKAKNSACFKLTPASLVREALNSESSMVNIITAYLAREILKASMATLLILYVILVSNALGRVLADIADGDIPARALWPVLLSHSMNILTLLLPVGVFLGIVFAFGRMYKDHEIVVMNACGIGYLDFYKPVAIVLLPIFAFSVYSSLWMNAQVQRDAQAIIDREKGRHEFEQLKPGQFNQSKSGGLVFFMESISADRLELRNVIISELGSDRRVLETADTGRQKLEESTGNLFLVIGPGERYEGEPGAVAGSESSRLRNEQLSPAELWNSPNLTAHIELYWRISTPVVLLVISPRTSNCIGASRRQWYCWCSDSSPYRWHTSRRGRVAMARWVMHC